MTATDVPPLKPVSLHPTTPSTYTALLQRPTDDRSCDALFEQLRTADRSAWRRGRGDGPHLGVYRYPRASALLRRAVDVTLSAGLLVALSPLLACIALTIRLTSPGPAIFRQSRIGLGETTFTIWKFRTMTADNDPSRHREFVQSMLREDPTAIDTDTKVFKMVEDPRITTVGRWLRKTSLDELPQLVNVLKGEMSLVGPRPCLAYEVSEYSEQHRLRAMCVPGITGLWQIEGRSDVHVHEALDLDLTYTQTCSLAKDLSILLRSIKVIVRPTGL